MRSRGYIPDRGKIFSVVYDAQKNSTAYLANYSTDKKSKAAGT
jgi:hypothetical protein